MHCTRLHHTKSKGCKFSTFTKSRFGNHRLSWDVQKDRVGRSTTYLRRVVHDGAEIIRHVPVHCVASPELTEGETDIFLMYFDVCISVRPLVLVPEAEGMSNLVHWYTELCEREHIQFMPRLNCVVSLPTLNLVVSK